MKWHPGTDCTAQAAVARSSTLWMCMCRGHCQFLVGMATYPQWWWLQSTRCSGAKKKKKAPSWTVNNCSWSLTISNALCSQRIACTQSHLRCCAACGWSGELHTARRSHACPCTDLTSSAAFVHIDPGPRLARDAGGKGTALGR